MCKSLGELLKCQRWWNIDDGLLVNLSVEHAKLIGLIDKPRVSTQDFTALTLSKMFSDIHSSTYLQ